MTETQAAFVIGFLSGAVGMGLVWYINTLLERVIFKDEK